MGGWGIIKGENKGGILKGEYYINKGGMIQGPWNINKGGIIKGE